MTNHVALSAIAASPPGREVAEPRPAPAAVHTPGQATPGAPSPTLRLDPALGLVVIEFVNKSGAVTSSIPTPQQLEAYKIGSAAVPGQQRAHPASHAAQPDGRAAPTAPAAPQVT